MGTGKNEFAGSRMTTSPAKPTATVRWTLLGLCGMLSLALVGAAKPQATPQKHVSRAETAKAAATPALTRHSQPELMHDIPAGEATNADAAMLASAVIPGSGLHHRVVWMQVTAYCGCKKCCGPKARGLTASGLPVTYNQGHFVAADARLFKFATKLIIPGYAGQQPVEVIDRGGAIKGNHLDVFVPTHEQAKEWGRKWIQVTVIE